MDTPEVIPDMWLIKLHESRRLVLARKYYFDSSLNKYKRFNTAIEITLGMSSGTVITLGIWNLVFPQQVVLYGSAVAAAITAILGILKPILRLSDKIEENSVLLENYERGVRQLKDLASTIEKDKSLTLEEFKKLYSTILLWIDPDKGPDEDKLRKWYDNRVNRTLPKDSWKISYISPKAVFSARERK